MASAAGQPLLIVGCGGHAKVVSDVAKALGYADQAFIDTTASASTFQGRTVSHHLPRGYGGLFFIAVGTNAIRQDLYHAFLAANPSASSPALVHPSSVIGSACSIAAGSVVMPLCVVNAGSRIAPGVIINTRSSVDHDCHLMEFSSLAPGCVLAGGVSVGQRSALGLASAVCHRIVIGDDVVVGGASFVNRDLEARSVAYGSPARQVRSRLTSDPYL
ncbi:MAG: transferase [Cyanobacteriota bacterium]|nr:transferase [Cyanobacteriota bacterium]